MITVKVQGNFKPLVEKLKSTDNGFTDFLLDLAVKLNESIRERVQNRGFGSSLTPMPKYSKKHRNKRKRRGLQTSFRDLTFTGNMFNSQTEEKIGINRVAMFFKGSEDNKAFFNEKISSFFALTSEEEKIIDDELNKKRFV